MELVIVGAAIVALSLVVLLADDIAAAMAKAASVFAAVAGAVFVAVMVYDALRPLAQVATVLGAK